MKRKKAVLIPFGVVALTAIFAATAFACTLFRGTFTITGNASSTSVTSTGLRTGMNQMLTSGIAKATATGGSVKVSTGKDSYGVGLPARSYQVRFYNGPGYTNHTNWTVDCMAGGQGTTLGTVSVLSDGKISGQPRSFALKRNDGTTGTLTKNTAPAESVVCISDSFATYGNQAPLTIM